MQLLFLTQEVAEAVGQDIAESVGQRNKTAEDPGSDESSSHSEAEDPGSSHAHHHGDKHKATSSHNEDKSRMEAIKAKLDSLVAAGKITQAQADQKLHFVHKHGSQLRARAAEASKNETSTSSNDASSSHNDHERHRFSKSRMLAIKAKLDSLVAAGKITQAQADQKLHFLDKYRKKKAAEASML